MTRLCNFRNKFYKNDEWVSFDEADRFDFSHASYVASQISKYVEQPDKELKFVVVEESAAQVMEILAT